MKQYTSYAYTSRKPMIQVLYNILNEFGVPMKLGALKCVWKKHVVKYR
jgi:hypothetical protein